MLEMLAPLFAIWLAIIVILAAMFIEAYRSPYWQRERRRAREIRKLAREIREMRERHRKESQQY